MNSMLFLNLVQFSPLNPEKQWWEIEKCANFSKFSWTCRKNGSE